MDKFSQVKEALRASVGDLKVSEKSNNTGEYIPLGLDGILASTEKLLAVNRGMVPVDSRDAQEFKRVYDTPALLKERVKMDRNKLVRKAIRNASKKGSLAGVSPFAFDDMMVGHLVGNPLSAPIEEINPLHGVDQSRRVTQMGPGGIGSDNAITQGMQNVEPGQFGFKSPLEGPESLSRDSKIFTSVGWIPAPEVTMEHEVACNIKGTLAFRHPTKVHRYPFQGDLIGVTSLYVDFLVTPNHRIWYRDTDKRNRAGRQFQMGFAEDLFDKRINIDTGHAPIEYPSTSPFSEVSGLSIPMLIWCKLLAYWLADGYRTPYGAVITHSSDRPAYPGICEALKASGLTWEYRPRYGPDPGTKGDFYINHKGLGEYLSQFGKAGDKFIPEYVLTQPIKVREAFLQALMETDRRINKTHRSFVSTSKAFARGAERLMISLGISTSFREEPDSREHVKSTNWVVSIFKNRERQTRTAYNQDAWYRQPYDDDVFCVTVEGGLIFIRRGSGYGHWTGNSERIGVDSRLSTGVRIGDDGNVYQKFRNRKTGKEHWLSPVQLSGKVVKIPD